MTHSKTDASKIDARRIVLISPSDRDGFVQEFERSKGQ